MSGVTIIKVDEGLDTGPVLTAQAVDIAPEEDAGRLTERLSVLGGRLAVDQIPGFLSGTVVPVAQSDEGVTYAAKLTTEDRPLALDGDARSFLAKVRGLAPTPGATLHIDGEPHRVLAARPHNHIPAARSWEDIEGSPVVAVGGEGIEIVTLQPPGKRPMEGAAWLRGIRVTSGLVA
jgi:methionyl-tRNA formyltransferase